MWRMNVRAIPRTIRTDERLQAVIESAAVREVLMGAQDNLTNVMAVVLGVGVGSGDVRLVALAGISAGVAEAISMAGVLYTSTLAELELRARDGVDEGRPRIGASAAGAVTGVAALVAGLVPLTPFAFLPFGVALAASLLISLAGLFGLGVLTATMTRRSWLAHGTRLVLVGGSAAVAAALIGSAFRV
jgi:VIT1/CCC1 family predicted Fe2+/Mn2+ transporter